MIHLRITGSGAPVLLLHGAPSSVEDFRPLVERLARRHRFLWPDLPGYGLTPAVEGHTTVAKVQTMLEDALLALGIHELAVVGYSFGAYRALSLALGGRVRVSDLVCLGGFARIHDADRAGIEAWRDAVKARPDFADDAFRKVFAERRVSAKTAREHPEALALISRAFDLVKPAVLADELQSLIEARDLVPYLGNLKSRLTLRVGAEDTTTPHRYSEEIALRVRGSVLQVVPGAGHALLVEDAHHTLDAIDQALKAQVAPHRDHEHA